MKGQKYEKRYFKPGEKNKGESEMSEKSIKKVEEIKNLDDIAEIVEEIIEDKTEEEAKSLFKEASIEKEKS